MPTTTNIKHAGVAETRVMNNQSMIRKQENVYMQSAKKELGLHPITLIGVFVNNTH